eukprot:9229738-Alexandrium_andersonii.AAC.1
MSWHRKPLKIAVKNLVMMRRACRISPSQHMKCSAICSVSPPFAPHTKCPLSRQGIRPGGNEVISKYVSARSASAACSDAENALAR